MERAAPWTEPEVRALIGIWSEEGIRRQLQGTLRNKGLFMYIALRMRQLGIFRDWKQCRSKYKNLKYEYRALRSSTRPPVYKIPFYDELHAILGEEKQELQGTEPGPEHRVQADLRSCEGGTSDLLHVPSVHNEGGKHWSARETLALINLWSDKSIRGQLKGSVRNQKIFEHIAGLLQQEGIDRDWRQCRTKYKNLKHEYAVVKKAQESGNQWKTMKYFAELDAVLSGKPPGYIKTNIDTTSPIPYSRTMPSTITADFVSEHPPERDEQDLSAAENVTAVNIKEETSSVDDNLETEDGSDGGDFRIVTVNDTGGGRNWSDFEVQSLLHVWSDERFSQRLDGTFRNKLVFEEISQKLMEFGINRDWKQCRRKYKNLKYEYHCIQKDDNHENQRTMRQTVKFYDQIDHILRPLQVHDGQQYVSVGSQKSLVESRTDSGLQDAAGIDLMETVNQALSAQLKRKASPIEPEPNQCADQKKPILEYEHEDQYTEKYIIPTLSYGNLCASQIPGSILQSSGLKDQVCARTKEKKVKRNED